MPRHEHLSGRIELWVLLLDVTNHCIFCPPILTLWGALLPPLRRLAVGFADHVSKLCGVSLQCPSEQRNHGLNECKNVVSRTESAIQI